LYIIENHTASGPGGWAGTRIYTDINEARRELAFLPEFKNPGEIVVNGKATLDDLLIGEYTIKQPLPTRQGVVGPQEELLIDTRGQNAKSGGTVWENYLKPQAQYKIGDRTLTPYPVVRKVQ